MSGSWGSFSVRAVAVAARRMGRAVPISVRTRTALASAESLPVPALVERVEFRELFLVEDLGDLRAGVDHEFSYGVTPFAGTAFRVAAAGATAEFVWGCA